MKKIFALAFIAAALLHATMQIRIQPQFTQTPLPPPQLLPLPGVIQPLMAM